MSLGVKLADVDPKVRVRIFYGLLHRANLPAPVPEYRFSDSRQWRADFAWPVQRVVLEVEGGIWTQGRHTRPGGFLKDLEKYNELAAMGWRLVRCTPETLATPDTVALLYRALTPQAA